MQKVPTLRKFAFLGFTISAISSLIIVILFYAFFHPISIIDTMFKYFSSIGIICYCIYLCNRIQLLNKTEHLSEIRKIESFTGAGVVILCISIFILLWISLFLSDGVTDPMVLEKVYFIWESILFLVIVNASGHIMMNQSVKRLRKHYYKSLYKKDGRFGVYN